MSEIESLRPLGAVLVALLAIAAVVAGRRKPVVRDGVPLLASVLAFAIVLSMVPDVLAGDIPTTNLGSLVADVEFTFRADPLGMVFALVVSGLWILTALYSIGYTRGTGLENRTLYTAGLCLSIGSGLGIAFSANLLTLVVFYELTTIGTYPLVTHKGTDRARRVGFEYAMYVIGGGTLAVGGTVLLFVLVGDVGFAPGGIDGVLSAVSETPAWMTVAAVSLLAGFGVKAAVMPVHAWLPKAMVAPTTVSGVLHAVVVVKSGVFGIARTLLYVLGPEAATALGVATPLAVVAAATILVASIAALQQDDLKRRLAYSTVANLSYIVFGIALLVPNAVAGGLFHIAAHGVAKLLLFFCVGAVAIETDVKRVSEIAGVGRRLPLTMGVFAVGACSLAGIPLFAGFASKWYLLVGGAEIHFALPAVLVASGALNVAYFWPIVYGAFFESPEGADPKPLVAGPLGGGDDTTARPTTEPTGEWWSPLAETHTSIVVSLGALAVLVVALGVRPGSMVVFDLATRVAATAIG